MQKIVLPSIEEVFKEKEVPPGQFDQTYKMLLEEQGLFEGYFMLDTPDRTHYLFISDGHPYSAGTYDSRGYKSVQIRDFFSTYLQSRPHVLSFHSSDEILTKGIIVLFQHMPTMQVTTDLVDVEEILDKIRQKGLDTILAIKDQNLSSIILCQQGVPSKTYLVDPGEAEDEKTPTDQMLVYIYSRSGNRNITIDVYQDIIISKAPDACVPPADYTKTIPDFFTRPQPDLHVMLGDQSITKYRIKGHAVKIGRVPENDIVINNLGVSRRHAEVMEEGGQYYLVDKGSVNGSFVNGSKADKALLKDKDEILIGKHKIIFQHSVSAGGVKAEIQESQTVMIDSNAVQKLRQAASQPPAKVSLPDGQTFELIKPKMVIGNGDTADIKVNDKSIAPEHAHITRDETGYSFVPVSQGGNTFVDGQPVTAPLRLTQNTSIQVGHTILAFEIS